jgi:manganese/zinc/iron transport system ATP- binding protein
VTAAVQAEPPALLLDQLRVGYEARRVLLGVSARLDEGQAVALVGRNGSGKSTLVKAVLGLLEPWSGRVEVFGVRPDRLDHRRRQIGYVPQIRDVDRAFPATVLDLVLMGRVGRLGLFRWTGARDRALALSVLARVGLTEKAQEPFGTLSGGQQQRVFLARALAQEPDLLVLDEPVAGVDAANRAEIGGLLSELRQQGIPLLVVTHDIDEVRPFSFDQQWRLVDGRLLVETPGSALEPRRHEQVPPRRTLAPETGRLGQRRVTSWG